MEVITLALICDIELEDIGLTINNAYLRIETFSGSETHVNFNLSVYINKESYDENRSPITRINYSTEFDKDRNLFRQMYEYLRSLPEYEDAVEA